MIPLVARSCYSLMWGTCTPRELVAAAKRLGYRRIALTDTDNLYGLWPFLRACEEAGIQPIVGAELTDPATRRRAVCLVETDAGYRNLCRLITRRHTDGDFDLLSAVPPLADGLTLLTWNQSLLDGWNRLGIPMAAAVPRKPAGGAWRLYQAAKRMGITPVAVPGSFFLTPAEFDVHRILRAIDCNSTLSRLHPGDTAPVDAWLAAPGDYADRFSAWPETLTATEALAERLTFTGPSRQTVLPPWTDTAGRQADECLREAAYTGARRRYGQDIPEPVVDRLEHELKIIDAMGFSPYFLVVRNIVRHSPRICGRGSGAASLVAYCLGITNVCPIKYNLYFERFLNPGRLDPPDIDVDFAWDERDGVLASVLTRYSGHAALVCNHVAFQPRMAIREVAKVFGLTAREIGQVTRRLPWIWRQQAGDEDLLDRLRQLPELGNIDFPHPWPRIIRTAQRLIGLPRHLSVHPGGVVITPDNLDSHVPIEIAPKGVPIIQWEKDATEDAGLVKIDLLGNRSLGVIRDALANLRENGIDFDENRWEPEDDPATQLNVARGNTMGCFYIESPAMRLLQQKAKVGDYEHLVIHSSIIRPAANDFIREYIRRLRGGAWEPIHPLLTDVLAETHGIMVYQEDVSRAAVALAGFSHAEADGLRKVMARKDRSRKMDDYRRRFSHGARQNGLTEKQIEDVWEMMMSFAGYSFCKPHSASYARVSFQAAYLKTHYPAEFMAAVISNQGGFYSPFAYVSEARRLGVQILPPDVNRSDIRWKGRQHAMRVGWLSVRHLSAETGQRIVICRINAPYRDIRDFLDRVRPGEPEARALIHAGALDSLHPSESRAALLWALALWRSTGANPSKTRNLFESEPALSLPDLPRETEYDRLRREFAALGFLCTRHPMTLYAGCLQGRGIVKARDLPKHTGRRVRIAGILITGKVVRTKLGDPMEFLTFEDETGLIETTFFPRIYHRFCSTLDRTRPFILTGTVDEDFGAITLTVAGVEPISRLNAAASSQKTAGNGYQAKILSGL